MGLDLNYIPSTYFQEALLDKTTGEPLAAGVVTFYRDIARTELKPMYRISGTPPNYTYTALPNPLTLSSIGTIQDGSGNDVVPYFFPFDAEGNVDLYYYTVVNSGAVAQFTRSGQPNEGVTNGEEDQFINYIKNGQFIAHNSIAETPSREEGEITEDLTNVAQGNWYFNRSASSTADDFVFFNRFGSPTTNPPDSPRYEIQIENTSPDVGDAFKWFSVRFRNVNTFESDTQQYTFSFSGKSSTATPISTLVNKNFGTGGDADVEIPLQNINLTTDYKISNIPVIFGDNAGKTLGDADDDFVEVVIALPTSAVFDVTFTNFILTPGDVTLTGYPVTPESEVSANALAGTLPMPEYEGQFLYLPIVNGPNGLEYDDRDIGNVIYRPTNVFPGIGVLAANGQVLDVDEYDSSGIPHRRIFEKYVWDFSQNFTINGAGVTFVTAESFSGTQFDIIGNDPAVAYPVAFDGTTPTGFSFTPISGIPYRDRVTFLAATSITAGAFFQFFGTTASATSFVAWYSKDGVGTQPVVGGITKYAKVEITGSDSGTLVGQKTIQALNSMYVKLIDVRGYVPRFTDNGAGRDPDAGSRSATYTGSLVSGDNANTIQGDENKSHAHTAVTRIRADNNNGLSSPNLSRSPSPNNGRIWGHQSDTNGIWTDSANQSLLLNLRSWAAETTIDANGGSESRPINIALEGFIKI